jgi:hypothetical protein
VVMTGERRREYLRAWHLKQRANNPAFRERRRELARMYYANNPAFRERRRLNSVWRNMSERCHNSDHKSFARYGARGITVCDRWRGPDGFETFLVDVGPRPSDTHTLDRIDNDGPYCPENCRWATMEQQSNNRRGNHRVTFNGQTLTVAQWRRVTGIKEITIRMRLKRGWPVAAALDSAYPLTQAETETAPGS